MKIEKGNQGYIRYRKKIDTIWLLIFVALGIGIFLAGYFITHTRANIFTVLGVLMVLPGAKRIVALFVMLPRKSVSRERYEAVREACEDAVLYTDYVFTSTERIMHLDFVFVGAGNVYCVIAPSKQDVDYMKKYVTDQVHKYASEYQVKFFTEDEELIQSIKRISKEKESEEPKQALLEFLESSIV